MKEKSIHNELGQSLASIESPVSKMSKSFATVDPTKLLKAWDVSVQVQRELVEATKKNLHDNERTRKSNVLTRVGVLVCMVVVISAAVFGKIEMNMARGELDDARTEVSSMTKENKKLRAELESMTVQNDELRKDLADTMRAMRATSGAFNTYLEQQAEDDQSMQAALEAQQVTLEVSAKIEKDPEELQRVKKKLRKVKEKAASLPAQPE